MLVPDIAKGFKDVETQLKGNYLVALAGIIRWLPFSVLEPQLPTLTPLLLQTLDIKGGAGCEGWGRLIRFLISFRNDQKQLKNTPVLSFRAS